jgi:hypothetical protein
MLMITNFNMSYMFTYYAKIFRCFDFNTNFLVL